TNTAGASLGPAGHMQAASAPCTGANSQLRGAGAGRLLPHHSPHITAKYPECPSTTRGCTVDVTRRMASHSVIASHNSLWAQPMLAEPWGRIVETRCLGTTTPGVIDS